jgi:nucleoredoxin
MKELQFDWKALPLLKYDAEHKKILDVKTEVSQLQSNKIGLYFSASWCSPCCRFTPVLIDYYTKKNREQLNPEIEIIFIGTNETSDESFTNYFSKMPWYAVPRNCSHPSVQAFLKKVSGLPTLIWIDKGTGKILTENGISEVLAEQKRK